MPEWASRLRDRLTDGLNEIGFRWRETMRWSAPAWKRPVGSWERARPALPEPGRDRADELARKFDLTGWPKLLTALEVQENLYTLDLLDRHLPALPPGPGLDVGAKDGVLLPALRAAWPHPWDLVEIDAHRRYLDLSTRRASGERMASAFPDCRYIADSVETLDRAVLAGDLVPAVRARGTAAGRRTSAAVLRTGASVPSGGQSRGAWWRAAGGEPRRGGTGHAACAVQVRCD